MANQVEKQEAVNTENAASTKEMKRGTIIQAVKAIAVLVCICLVCGALLALCNDLLYVSDDVKTSRKMQKVYPGFSLAEEPAVDAAGATTPYGTVQKIYKSTDGAYVFQSTSNGVGFSGGNVTLLVAVSGGTEPAIAGWTILDNAGQSFIANIKPNYEKKWHIGSSITEVQPTVAPNTNAGKGSGATYTENAIANAINAACYYAINTLKLVSTPESEAKDAIVALLADKAAGYNFVSLTDTDYFAACKAGEKELSFYFEGTKDGATPLAVFVYGEDDNRQIVVVDDSLSHADRLTANVVASTDGATEDMVTAAKTNGHFEFTIKQIYAEFVYDGLAELDTEHATTAKGKVNKVYKSANGAIVIEATGNEGWDSGTVTINVVIADNTIKAWSIVSNDKQSFIDKVISNWDKIKDVFVNDSIYTEYNTVTPDAGQGHGTGATWSENAITNAIKTACSYASSTTQQGGAD